MTAETVGFAAVLMGPPSFQQDAAGAGRPAGRNSAYRARIPTKRPPANAGACQSLLDTRKPTSTRQMTVPAAGTQRGISNRPAGSLARPLRTNSALFTTAKTESSNN